MAYNQPQVITIEQNPNTTDEVANAEHALLSRVYSSHGFLYTKWAIEFTMQVIITKMQMVNAHIKILFLSNRHLEISIFFTVRYDAVHTGHALVVRVASICIRQRVWMCLSLQSQGDLGGGGCVSVQIKHSILRRVRVFL